MSFEKIRPANISRERWEEAFANGKLGIKNGPSDRELLDKQMRRLVRHKNYGAIAVTLVVMFLIGMTVGGVLSAHNSEPIQIASID